MCWEMEAYVAISGPLDILKFEGAIFIFIFYKKKIASLNFVIFLIFYFHGLELLLFELWIYPSGCFTFQIVLELFFYLNN